MIRLTVAVLLFALGLIGILLPVIPGVPFLLIALFMFGVLSRRNFLRYSKRFRGRRGSLWRRMIACVLIRIVYRKKFSLK